MVSERKQDSSSQTMPVEDKSDPPEGSEEAAEPRTDTPEGEGGRSLTLQRGRGLGQWGAGVVMEAGILQGGWGGEPRPHLLELVCAISGTAVIHLPSIPDQESPHCPDGITKEKRTAAPEPESCVASEPPAKRSKR